MIGNKEKKSLARSSFYNLITSLISKLGGLVFIILLARLLLPEKFGIYSIVVAVVTIIAAVFDVGLSQALVRFYSERYEKNKKKAYAYYEYLFKMKLRLSIIASIAILLLAYPLSFLIFKNQALFVPLMFASLYLFTLSIDSFYVHLFYAIKKLNYVTIRETLSQILKVGLLVAFFFVFERSNLVISAIMAISISYGLSIAYMIYYKKKIIGNPKLDGEKVDKKELIDFMIFIALINLVNSIFFYMDLLILGLFVRPEFLGYYKSAFSLVQGIVGIGMAPVLIILPYLMTLSRNGQEKISQIYIKFIALLSIPASFGLIVLGRYFLVLLFGREYLPAYYSLAVLSLLIFPQIVISALFFNIFSARNSPKLFFKLIASTTILNILLNFVLIVLLVRHSELWATVGASIACLISWIYYFFHSSIILRKNFKIRINYIVLLKPIIASLIMAGAILLSLKFIKDMNILYGAAEIALGSIVYFIALLLLKFIDKSDINKIKLALLAKK